MTPLSDKYSTIKQHEPLRVPNGWGVFEKRFIAQLEEIFDDIYSRFGRLRMSDMGTQVRKEIAKGAEAVAGLADLATTVTQTAEKLESKAEKTIVSELSGIVTGMSTTVTQTADGLKAVVGGTTPVGAVASTKVQIDGDGVAIATGGTFTVDSGNFVLDEDGNVTANGARINGTLLHEGKPVLTSADIYIGTVEPSQKRAGMVWIQPGADDYGNESAQTTHSAPYPSGSRHTLRSYPQTVTLEGTSAATSASNYAYDIIVPIYFGGNVDSGTVSVTLGGRTFSATVSGKLYGHQDVRISGNHTQWLGNSGYMQVVISASTDNILSERSNSGYLVTCTSRAY